MLEHWRVRLPEKDGLAAGGGRDCACDGAGAGDLEPAAIESRTHWIRWVGVRREEQAFRVGAQTHSGAEDTREGDVLVESADVCIQYVEVEAKDRGRI